MPKDDNNEEIDDNSILCKRKNPLLFLENVLPVEKCEDVPSNYIPVHLCMKTKIVYNTTIPTHGDHRPLWPVYGDYQYVPPQRWLHTVEHGGVVMLYHPCTHPIIVKQLKSLVTRCIRKHVITPHRLLPLERPLALVAWGCKLLMNHVEKSTVVNFIKTRALHGPEGNYTKEGQYSLGLIDKAEPPLGSDEKDSHLCPGW
ncbi:uncharacterized protein LOC106468283 [Limulus polyphemus]|uniref:Uncharacterized protein LOC106468283 n=1 Tax=Limulus polyphemus TaxID=6850 RepID=A0ABM1T8X0_LIMPO|nr:uncharacterized protein LOC106468283 [Limulus polyphemus]